MNSGNNKSWWKEISEKNPEIEIGESDAMEMSPDGRYIRFNEILGRGAFKNVYKGFDEINGIEVAWNQVSIEALAPEHLKMLYSEVYLLKTLKHENVIRSYASWVDDKNKTVNMITELLTSGNLRQYRKKHKSVDMKAIKNWARQILRGLCYLHSQNPPIIHRDLKGDNIFVNGNHGEVKIGDLGLATIMHQPTARSVIGTPEFMAPELYDEEYNELVDIYSFGMCVLELVTCEYPYSECKNHAQIYKKATSGIKPAALGKINDPEVKSFIEKCLAPASQRPSAAELLNVPFLLCEYPANNSPLQLSDFAPNSKNLKKSDSPFMDVDTSCKMLSGSTCESMIEASVFHLKLHRNNERYKFSLEGEKLNDNKIHLFLRIAGYKGGVRNIHFDFFLNADTASSIALEMVATLDLWQVDVDLIAELIDNMIFQFFPRWGSSGSVRHEKYATSGVGECSYTKDASKGDTTHSEITYNGTPMSLQASVDTSASNANDLVAAEKHSRSIEQSLLMDESVKDSGSVIAGSWAVASSDMRLSISSLSLTERENGLSTDLKTELNEIYLQYQHRFRELLKMRDAEFENAKRKWLMKKVDDA